MNRYVIVFFSFFSALLITFFFDYGIFWYIFLGGPAVVAGVILLILFKGKDLNIFCALFVAIIALVCGLVGELLLRILFVERMSEGRIYNEIGQRFLLFIPPEFFVFCLFVYLHKKLSSNVSS